MTHTATPVRIDEIVAALDRVVDPELDEPITQLGFVRSVDITDGGVEVHLRLPTSFCSPNFAYLMTSDAYDALTNLPEIGLVRVVLDDHHDSDKINAGIAAQAGYRATFGVEAQESLDDLRNTFLRKAHIAAMQRCCEQVLRTTEWTIEELHWLTLGDIKHTPEKEALIRRRAAIGLGTTSAERVLVEHDGELIPESALPMRLRFAKAVRISIEGNSHFCRGLLRTRYADEENDQAPPTVITDRRSS